MSITSIAMIVVAIVVCLMIYSTYVSVVKTKNNYYEASSSIDVQLKKRYDLIPNILTLTKKFMEHEINLMTEITNLRTQAIELPKEQMDKKLALDSQIKEKMGQFLVSVENYPKIKSDATIMTAIQTYNEVEEHIAAARRFYNSAVKELNNAIEIFPTSIFANMLEITKKDFIKTSEAEKKPINASDYLK